MGIRRRRKKVSTILTTIDRRLKSVELRRVPKLIKNGTITKRQLSVELQASLEKSEDAVTDGLGVIAPTFTVKPYVNITKIVYAGYSSKTGRDRARAYFETNPGVNVGDKFKLISVRTILNNPNKTGEYIASEVAVIDGAYTVVYSPGWERILSGGAVTYNKGVRIQSSNVSVTGATVGGSSTTFSKGQIQYYTKGNREAGFETRDDYYNGPTYPSGVETPGGETVSDWTYNVGDLINLDGLGTNFDGVHKITSKTVSSDGLLVTLQFDFATPLVAPVTLPSSNGSIRPAGGRYVKNGETYTDTSVTPAITYVWDDNLQKWWNMADPQIPEGVLIDDGVAPSPPTGVSGTSTGYVSGTIPKSKVNLSWSAPTTNSDGTNLSDLSKYKIYYKDANTAGDFVLITETKITSVQITELTPQKAYDFVVTAEDKTSNESEYSTAFTITTSQGSLQLDVPSVPKLTTKLGTVSVEWDLKNYLGADMSGSATLSGVEVHRSTTSGFTASAATYLSYIDRNSKFTVDATGVYNTTYYYKFIAYDYSGNKTAASAQASIQVKALVDTDMIASTLTQWPFVGEVVSASALATGAVSAAKLAENAINSSNFATVIQANALTADVIAAGAIGADEIAAGAVIAGKIAADAVTADKIQALAITAGKIDANAVTADKILAGSVTAVKIASRSITGEKILSTTTLSFASASDGLGNPAAFSDQVVIGNHVVSGYGGNVTVTGLSFYRSGVRTGILGSGTWAAMSFGADEIVNALQFSDAGSGRYDSFLRATASLTISATFGTQIFGTLASNGYFFAGNGARMLGPVEFYGGRVEVVRNTVAGLPAAFRIFENNTSVFGIWANETYRDSSATEAARVAALLHADTSTMTLRTKNVVVTSTRASKEDIEDYPIDKRVLGLSPKTFRYRNESDDKLPIQLGLIAEEVGELGLDVILVRDKETNEPTAIDYMKIPVLLVPVVKDIEDRLTALESRMQADEN